MVMLVAFTDFLDIKLNIILSQLKVETFNFCIILNIAKNTFTQIGH